METQLVKSVPSAYFLFMGNSEGISVWLNLALITCIYQAGNRVTCKMLNNSTHVFSGHSANQLLSEIQALKSRGI